jgi:uncharacterized protein with HEPN domain
MRDEINKYLTDIINSIEGIDIHLGHKRDFSFYSSNVTVKRAVERELEIIGEAVSRILKTDSNFPISYARTIVDLRNRVIHAYDAIDDNLMWRIIIKDIPILKEEIENLLKP